MILYQDEKINLFKIVYQLTAVATFVMLPMNSYAAEYEIIRPALSGVYAAKKASGWGYVTKNKEITNFNFDSVINFSKIGLGAGKLKGNYYIYNPSGKVIGKIDGVDKLFAGDGQKWIYSKGDKYGVIDMTSLKKNSAKYDYILEFYKGYAWVMMDNKAGLIDENERFIIPLKPMSMQTSGLVNDETIVFCKNGKGNKVAVVINLKAEIVLGSGCGGL